MQTILKSTVYFLTEAKAVLFLMTIPLILFEEPGKGQRTKGQKEQQTVTEENHVQTWVFLKASYSDIMVYHVMLSCHACHV